MGSITIGIFGENPEGRQHAANALAKKGSAEDISVYQTVYSGKIISVVEPTKYPEKVATLAYSAYLSDYCVVLADAMTPALGEIIVTLDLLGKKHGCIISSLDLKPMTKGTNLENYGQFESVDAAREKIYAFEPERDASAPVFGSIDHSFEVKGVGSILLGFLHSGKISVHDKLKVHPSGKELEVRSIQMHDEDVKETNAGDRFGLAIRLLTSKDVARGDIVTRIENNLRTGKELDVNIQLSKFAREPLKNGEQIHAFHFLEDSPCKWSGEEIAGGKDGKGKLIFDKPFSFKTEDPILVVRLDAKGLRVIGKV
ncbi:MAG: EF-Tu/IF-2/RF-3 family GTPase [Candidatus Micrarchaeota archaeon]